MENKNTKAYKNKLAYIKSYNKRTFRQIILRFNQTTDKKILDHLDRQKSKTDYIRQLIVRDMK